MQYCTIPGKDKQISCGNTDVMESYQKESIGRIRRNSKTLLQDVLHKGVRAGDRDTPVPAQSGRDAKMIHSIASLIRGKSKLLLLESPDTVEIYKLNKPTVRSSGTDHAYLPAVTAKTTSNLSSMRGTLSQSCPYLYNKRRGSFSSVGSQKTGDYFKKKSNIKALKEAKKSNVNVTMTYLGQGRAGSRLGSSQDELKVLQQVNGGENICVFKGVVTPGEQFQFVSQRHRGYPFSATMYVNGMMAARISSCCEYRYAPGFQQGRKSCFRLTWLAGGMPCYRCTSLRNKYSSCQQLNNGANENLSLPQDQNPANGSVESCPSSPLFLPAKPEKKSVRRTRRHRKESGSRSTDSEDLAVAGVKDTLKPKRLKGQSSQREDRGKTAAVKRAEEGQDIKGSEVSQRTTAETVEGEDHASYAGQDRTHQRTSTKEDHASYAGQDRTHQKTSTKEDHASYAGQDRTHQKTSTKEDHASYAGQDRTHQKTSTKEDHASSYAGQDRARQRTSITEDHASYAGQDRARQRTSITEDHASYAGQDRAHQRTSTKEDHASSYAGRDRTRPKTSKTKVKTPQKDHQDFKSPVGHVPDSLREAEAPSKQNGRKEKERGSDGKSRDGERLRDFYEECVEMSASLEPGQSKQNCFKANILERCRLQKKLSSCPNAASSDVEPSEESDSVSHPNEEPDEQDTASQSTTKEDPEEDPEEEEEPDLQAQLDAMMTMLNTSDEVEQLVLRNTDLTDDLLLSLVGALKNSPSEVKLLNLNLNRIGPYGAVILLDLLRAKPQVKGLLLFGNQLRDHGVQSLLSGIAELQEQTRAVAIQQALAIQAEQHTLHPEIYNNLQYMVSLKVFALLELDIGGNGLSSDGLRMLASYMSYHSHLQYLGLAQTSTADLAAWKELFDGLKGNGSLTHIILDESNLGDPGVRLLADVLRVNASLTRVDLDRNGVSDVGGNDIMGALLCRTQFPLRHLSLEENDISAGLMSRIKQEVKCK